LKEYLKNTKVLFYMVDSNLRSLGEFEYGAIAHLAVPRGE
jgi:hypothetical protein